MSKSKSKSTKLELPKFEFKTIHLLLTLLDRERAISENIINFYPKAVDPNYSLLIQMAGQQTAQIVHPDAVDKFLEMFPHLYRYFDCDMEQVLVWKQKKQDEFDVSLKFAKENMPGFSDNIPTVQKDGMQQHQLFDTQDL